MAHSVSGPTPWADTFNVQSLRFGIARSMSSPFVYDGSLHVQPSLEGVSDPGPVSEPSAADSSDTGNMHTFGPVSQSAPASI